MKSKSKKTHTLGQQRCTMRRSDANHVRVCARARQRGGYFAHHVILTRTFQHFGCCEFCRNCQFQFQFFKAQCKDFGGCTFDEDAYYCYGQGGKIPCTMRYPDGEFGKTCPSDCQCVCVRDERGDGWVETLGETEEARGSSFLQYHTLSTVSHSRIHANRIIIIIIITVTVTVTVTVTIALHSNNQRFSAISQGCIEPGGKVLCEVIYDEETCKMNGRSKSSP